MHSIEDYDILCAIDRSSDYSAVYKALDKNTGRIVAIKVINLVNQNDLAQALETYTIKPFKHICQVYVSFGKDGKLFIVMEYFAGGSLKDLVSHFKQNNHTLSNEYIQVILLELLRGVHEIHSESLVHRHIKSANLFLSAEGRIKLSYFSTNKEFSDTLNKSQSHILSLPFWMAPETIQTSMSDQRSDIWAIGITAYELITGVIPYEGLPPQKAIFEIVKGPPPRLHGDYPTEMMDFVNICLNLDPSGRPTANQLLEHPFIRNAKKKQLMFELFETSVMMRAKQNQCEIQQDITKYTHSRIVTSDHLDIIPKQDSDEPKTDALRIKRIIRKIEKYKPGLAKIIFQETLQAYRELEPADYLLFQ